MAVISNPPVRSTRRRNTLSNEDADRDPPPLTHLGKRPRNLSSTNGDFVSSKKQRPEQILPTRTRDTTRVGSPTHKQFVDDTATLSGAHGARGVRVISAVQPPATGTIIANYNTTAANANGHRGVDAHTQSSSSQESKPVKELEKRSLRSHDGGSRSRSELSLYFPNYEDFISNEPKEPELLTADTRIFVIEEPPKSPTTARTCIHTTPTSPSFKLASPTFKLITPRKPRPPAISTKSSSPTDFSRIDLNALASSISHRVADELTSPVYHKAHRRAERQEKQLKNIEKERAQHEKVQLERLYDGLRGPDWLRVMGISGITEGERKSWEGKRAYFVQEVGALLEKFRRWREEEKRRRVEKEAEAAEEEKGSEEPDLRDSEAPSKASPASSDVDAMAAQQLHNETISASAGKAKQGLQKKKAGSKTKPWSVQPVNVPVLEPLPQKPMTSFFAKPHQRAAALDKNRRSGRNKLAFGHPVPDLVEKDFELPEEMINEDALRANARNRRRARRGTET